MFAHTHSKLLADQVEPAVSFERSTIHDGMILFETLLKVLFSNTYQWNVRQ